MSQTVNADIFNQLFKYFDSTAFVKYSILPAVLLLAGLSGQKVWSKVEILLSLITGSILFVYPKPFLSLQMKGSIDNYQLFLCSLMGCYVIYAALFPIFLQKSKDESVFISHYWNRIISCNLIFIAMFFSYMNGLRWNYTLLCLSGGPVLVTMLVNAYFLKNSTNIRSQNHYNLPANTVAKFEFFMLLSAGLILFAFPDQAMLDLKSPNDSHRLLARICGIMLFSLSFESFTMPSFLFEKDKQSFLAARLLGSLLELVVILLGFYYYKVLITYKSLGICLFINTSYNLLIAYGYWSCLSRMRDLKRKADDHYNATSPNTSLNTSMSTSLNASTSEKKSS